jgi:glucosyl-3-phosphoglycerate phosphatase
VAEASRRLLLLRHGRTAWNHERRAQGHADVPLDEIGHAQAAAAAPAIAALRPAMLWSSDLARARQTAAYVSDACGLPATHDPRLREYALGERTGWTMAEYAAAHPDEYAEFRRGRYDVVPGSEKTPDVLARMTAALDEAWAALTPGELGVVVSHGAALKVTLLELLGWPEALAPSLRAMDNCGWAVLEDVGPGQRLRLVAYNRVPDFETPRPSAPQSKDFASHEGVG